MFTFSSGKWAMTANGSALLRYVMIISVQKLTQVVKLNIAGFLRMQKHNKKILKRTLKKEYRNTTGKY